MRLEFNVRAPQYRHRCDFPLIRIGALTLLNKRCTNDGGNDGWNIAAWHHKDSITWRWLLDWSLQRSQNKIMVSWSNHRKDTGSISIRFPLIGTFSYQYQPSMFRGRDNRVG